MGPYCVVGAIGTVIGSVGAVEAVDPSDGTFDVAGGRGATGNQPSGHSLTSG